MDQKTLQQIREELIRIDADIVTGRNWIQGRRSRDDSEAKAVDALNAARANLSSIHREVMKHIDRRKARVND